MGKAETPDNATVSRERRLAGAGGLRLALVLGAFCLLLLGQYARLYLPTLEWQAFLCFAAGALAFVVTLAGSRLAPPSSLAPPAAEPTAPPRPWVALALPLAALAWWQSSGNAFTALGVGCWLAAVVVSVAGLWTRRPPSRSLLASLRCLASPHALALFGVIGLAAFFRLYRLEAVPPEMNSDHVEKLYDVFDVLRGHSPIFFERNTGREPLQFYFVAALSQLLGTGLTFYSLKLSNAAAGILSVLAVYLFGRELGGRRIGLLAAFFAAVSIWPVATSRIGLRFPFAPAGAALALWLLLRALRTGRRNDWLLAGITLGAGLYGYTAYRIVPLAAVVFIALHMAAWWPQLRERWQGFIANVGLYVATAGLTFLPLAHYMVERPYSFWYRSLTRAAEAEHPLPTGVWEALALTTSRTLGMFNWRGDEVWVSAIRLAPVLDVIGGSLFLLGILYALCYLSRRRRLLAAQLLGGGYVLLLPSMLNLAFPNESPSVVRAGTALPVVAVLVALALNHLVGEVQAAWRRPVGPTAAAILAAAILVGMAALNYERYFGPYAEQYAAHAMNTAEVSAAIRAHLARGGDFDQVYLKSWPHWLDTRAISLQVEQKPGWEVRHVAGDTAALLRLQADRRLPALYVLHPNDREALAALTAAFPAGRAELQRSRTPGKDFVFFFTNGGG